ncbi:hypothetical protein BU225_20945, partial [Stenotrophomonas sp. MB339]
MAAARRARLDCRPSLTRRHAGAGVRGPDKDGYYVTARPAAPYCAKGVAPVSIWLSTEFARAAKGGTGAALGRTREFGGQPDRHRGNALGAVRGGRAGGDVVAVLVRPAHAGAGVAAGQGRAAVKAGATRRRHPPPGDPD